MADILWLDDQSWQVSAGVEALRGAGHRVNLVATEDKITDRLESGVCPDLLIQDLEREEVIRGWSYYENTLKWFFPQLPVIICSFGATDASLRKQADDYNLLIVDKAGDLASEITEAATTLLKAQVAALVERSVAPHIVAVDFDKVNSALLRHLARNPKDLHSVGWAAFERLVERLLAELGYEVVHTPLTRDGGADLWAVQRGDLAETLYAIDAKKYAPDRLIGPEPVRAIHAVADLAGANVGMIVTTSHFGPAALKLAQQHRYRIALKDFDGIVDWLKMVAGRFTA